MSALNSGKPRILQTSCCLTILVLATSTAGKSSPEKLHDAGVLFYASFDTGPGPDFYAGTDPMAGVKNRGRTIPGARSNAWAGRIIYRAQGNIDAERGTIAFYARNPYLVVESKEWGFYHWMLVVLPHAQQVLRPWAMDLAGFAKGTEARVKGIDLARWHHYALTWDRLYGSCFYIDGRLVSKDWGDSRGWAKLLTPFAITARARNGIDEL